MSAYEIGDKVVWAEIEFSQHHLEVFFFSGTITDSGKTRCSGSPRDCSGPINNNYYGCTPDLAGGTKGCQRWVQKEACWSKHGECRVWTLGKLENMKRDLARMFNDKIKSLTPKEKP